MAKVTPADTPREIIAAADAEIEEADALAESLEAAARNGDDSVTADSLEDAKKRSVWARIRRDAAEKRAVDRAEEIRRAEYKALTDSDIPIATVDYSEQVEALLVQARAFLEEAMSLQATRNRAVWRLATYATDISNYRDVQDEFMGDAPRELPGAAWFEWHGDRIDYRPASDVVSDLLKPLKSQIRTQSGGLGEDLLKAL